MKSYFHQIWHNSVRIIYFKRNKLITLIGGEEIQLNFSQNDQLKNVNFIFWRIADSINFFQDIMDFLKIII